MNFSRRRVNDGGRQKTFGKDIAIQGWGSKEIVIMREGAFMSAEPWRKSVVEAGYTISDCPAMSFVLVWDTP